MLPSFLRKKKTVWLTVLKTCPTTQLSFITATAKGAWGLVSSIASLSVSPTVADQTLLLVAGAFANNLTSRFLRLPTTCKREMAEKQVQKNTLSLGDRVKLINYVKRIPALELEELRTYTNTISCMYRNK